MMIKDEYINSKYKQIRFLGEGGFGKVILAKNKFTNSYVAIKYIDLEEMSEDERDKIIQEGQILFKLNHKNITKFEDFSVNNERAILIMEYAEGGDLNLRIKEQRKKGLFKEEIIITWFLELCNVVKFCHQRHILHRDLKPKNIFLTKDDHIKLGDFGISKVLKSIDDRAKTKIGTSYYLSPEVIKGEEYSYSCDIWSLGMILYELCLLKHPLIHIKSNPILFLMITNGNLGKLNKNCEENYSEGTCNLIKKILVKNPYERPTIDEIIKECDDILFNLKYKKNHYYNNSVFKFTIFNNSSKPEFTKELHKNFRRGVPDGKYVITINDEEKKFHYIHGKRVYDYTKKIQERNNVKIFQQQSEVKKQNFIDEVISESSGEDELRKTITKIRNEGLRFFSKGEKKEEPYKIKNNLKIDLPDIKMNNSKNNLKNKKIYLKSNNNYGQRNEKKSKRVKSTDKKYNYINNYGNIINKEINKVKDSVDYKKNINKKSKSNEHFSTNYSELNSNSEKTTKYRAKNKSKISKKNNKKGKDKEYYNYEEKVSFIDSDSDEEYCEDSEDINEDFEEESEDFEEEDEDDNE